MKNIEAILAEAGVTVTDEQKTAINKAVSENYKTVADYDKQKDKLTVAEEKVKSTEEALKAFDGVDLEATKKQIADLQADLKKKDDEYQAQIADRDFSEILKESIASAGGKNAKAIKALLDVDKLKGSKNQKEDVAAAIKELSEAEDSKMLFGEADPTVVEKTNPIGAVNKPGAGLSGVEAEFYKRNPDLKPE
jgi:DNA polymerase III delta prime subunit